MDKLIPAIGAAALAVALLWPDGGGMRSLDSDGPAAVAASVKSAAPPAAPPAPDYATGQVAIPRAHDGHFYAEAQVNGARIRGLVDTGASSVVLSRADAQAAGIAARPGEFTARGDTAGGEIALKPVTINRLALGNVVAHNVPAVIPERDIGISLLGQSFLARVRTVEIADDELRLR